MTMETLCYALVARDVVLGTRTRQMRSKLPDADVFAQLPS